MDYRGHDLDLRTSRWSATSTDPTGWREIPSGAHAAQPPRSQQTSRSGPIWVDETVLSCANQAYDIALAYRSAEVRLEHLLLAMTREEAAAATLEKHGVRVAVLRRDCAVSIAADLPSAEEGEAPRRSHELEDVLRVAASRAAHHGGPATVDDIIQMLSEIGGDLPGGDLVTRHVPRHSREYWAGVFGHRPAPQQITAAVPDTHAGEQHHAVASATPIPTIDPALIQRLFDRLSDVERAFTERIAEVGRSFSERVTDVERSFAERLTALETAVSHRPNIAPVDISPLDNRLLAIEAALQSRPSGEGVVAIDPAITDRLWAIEHALGTERTERASAITQLSDEISAVRSAVRLAAQSSEQTQAQLGEEVQKIATEAQSVVLQLQQFADSAERNRIDLSSSIGDRIATIEKALDTYDQKTAEAHAVYSGELSEVHDALMKISANQHTLAGALDSWRNNDSGEIHLINARIGAVHEDGAKRLSALEKLCADVETLSQLVLEDRSKPAPRSSFKQWLYGTEDWLRASWQRVARAPAEPKPRPSSRGFWPFRRRSSAL